MKILPDSSMLIAYFARGQYSEHVERSLERGRLVLCSVVAEEVMAGARNQYERQRYDRFFDQFVRLGLVITPDAVSWRASGRLLSRYRERYGAIAIADHQNDVLIALTARVLAQSEETTIMTENDADFRTWLRFMGDYPGLRLQALRRA